MERAGFAAAAVTDRVKSMIDFSRYSGVALA
jgi:hypothetical protein